jgi:hypothetical protein
MRTHIWRPQHSVLQRLLSQVAPVARATYVSSYELHMCARTNICVLILLYMCPHTALSSCTSSTSYMCAHMNYICVLILIYICVLILLYMCPHPTVCPHTAICVLILPYVCPHPAMCFRILLYVSSYCYICVLILLYVCPHTPMHVCHHAAICSVDIHPLLQRLLFPCSSRLHSSTLHLAI